MLNTTSKFYRNSFYLDAPNPIQFSDSNSHDGHGVHNVHDDVLRDVLVHGLGHVQFLSLDMELLCELGI